MHMSFTKFGTLHFLLSSMVFWGGSIILDRMISPVAFVVAVEDGRDDQRAKNDEQHFHIASVSF